MEFKFYYHIHNQPYLSLYFSKVIHSSHYVFKTHFNIIRRLTIIFSQMSLTFRVPNKNLQEFLTSYASAICSTHLTLIDLITLMTLMRSTNY
jgi:hypothetical protein